MKILLNNQTRLYDFFSKHKVTVPDCQGDSHGPQGKEMGGFGSKSISGIGDEVKSILKNKEKIGFLFQNIDKKLSIGFKIF
jgi:hypothetical protein